MNRQSSRSINPTEPSGVVSQSPQRVQWRVGLVIALGWLVSFFVWFQSFGFPNNPRLTRAAVWSHIPLDLLDVIDPPSPWSWLSALQRLPYAIAAISIWAAAWALGSLILRAIRVKFARSESFFFSLCLGLAGISLAMLALGLCGLLNRWLVTAVLSLISVGGLLAYFRSPITPYAEPLSPTRSANSVATLSWLGGIVLTAVTPFVVAQMLGAMSPQNDFDAVEYHLGGPKEWFQQGQISRLPHNVYTSFPCLVEMLILTGMVICGDWQWGSLAGQAVIAGFAPLTAVGLFAAGRRVFSNEAGWLAVLIYLTSPWTYRISIIAGVENGLACYLFAAFFAWLVLQDHLWQEDPLRHPAPFRLLFMTGLLAGCAMACKYTGLVSVVVPIAVLVIWSFRSLVVERRLRQLTLVLVILIAGVSATVGPWLIKNAVETGNPVYPLAVRVFGGTDRNAELDEKWRKGHAAKQYDRVIDRVVDLPIKLTDVMANNDWHSPLMFAFAPLSLFWFRRLRYGPELIDRDHACRHAMVSAAWLYVAWQFLTWWLLTHHIDRFYVPMFSVVGVLSGAGACWTAAFAIKSINDRGARIWNIAAAGLIIAAIIYNAEIMLLVGGFNGGRLDLMTARQIATPPRIHWLNEEFEAGRLPSNMKVLCVGEAQMFHARYRYVYNTVFDHSLFEELCVDSSSGENRLKSAVEILAAFQQQGITHIDVNWAEILRYRAPGSYGYTDFVRPDCFVALQRIGVLDTPLILPRFAVISRLGDDDRKQLLDWGPSLITKDEGKPAFVTGQVFPVHVAQLSSLEPLEADRTKQSD